MAHAAEQKSSLIGATRAQVLERLGEPRGILAAGNREIFTFEQQRVTLRDGVVVAVETIGAAPAPSSPPAADTSAAPAAGAQPAPAQPADATASPAEPGASSATPTPSQAAAPKAPATRDSPLSIKSVRPPGSARPAPKQLPKQEATEPAAAVPPSTSAIGQAEQAAKAAAAAEPHTAATPSMTPRAGPAPATVPKSPLSAVATTPAPEPIERSPDSLETKKAVDEEAAAKSAEKTKAKAKAPRRPLPDEPIEDSPFLTTKNIVLGLAVVGAGFALLMWMRRQRQLELAATAVSRTPFESPTASGIVARFTPDLLGKLEWKRFEELVALYYSKTGVIAVRTKTGPASPVHIKISWKGEPRPFAYVQCIAHPPDLIEPQPLQDLVAALAAEDIRRGYVVTTGRFSVAARDLAEEKHLTLLPADILLEKLNALPDTARSEIMQEITKGDYQTPSCPKCEAKMVRTETGVWRCAQHPEVTVPNKR